MTDHPDTDSEPWTLPELTDCLKRNHPDQDGGVVRELTRRMAEQLPTVKTLDPGFLALDLAYALVAVSSIARTLIGQWMSDLETDERPRDLETLPERLLECAKDFSEISGTF